MCGVTLTALFLVAVTVLIFNRVKYAHNESGSIYISPNVTVQVRNEGFDPLKVRTISISAAEADNYTTLKFYLKHCSELHTCNTTVMEKDSIEINPGRNTIESHYLLPGSTITYKFTMNETISHDCDTVLYAMKSDSTDIQPEYATIFGQDGSKSNLKISPPVGIPWLQPAIHSVCLNTVCLNSVCLNNATTNFTITSQWPSYYSIEIYSMQDESVSVDYQVSRNVFFYNTSEMYDRCELLAGENSTCSFPLDPVHGSSEIDSYCVLGQIVGGNKTSHIKYNGSNDVKPTTWAEIIAMFIPAVIGILMCSCQYHWIHKQLYTHTP